MSSAPPTIFSPARRIAIRQRMQALQQRANAARYIIDDMVEDVVERIAFLRHEARNALIIGEWTGTLGQTLATQNCVVTQADPTPAAGEIALDEERPYPAREFDLIVSLSTLDTVNDLPGALIHIRNALAPGGLMIASFLGAGSLPILRAAMLAADGDRPAARLHPMVDVRAGGQLLQRCGFARPVIDSRPLDVRFGSLASLVADLRAQGLSNVLASSTPPLTKAMVAKAGQTFLDGEDRVTERFEILTLSGWRT